MAATYLPPSFRASHTTLPMPCLQGPTLPVYFTRPCVTQDWPTSNADTFQFANHLKRPPISQLSNMLCSACMSVRGAVGSKMHRLSQTQGMCSECSGRQEWEATNMPQGTRAASRLVEPSQPRCA